MSDQVPGPLLQVNDLRVRFPVRGGLLGREIGEVRAVDGLDFEIARGETLALVGESGCGKSTTGYAVMGMQAHEGTVALDGRVLSEEQGARATAREMQLIYQDPTSALNPRLAVGQSIEEPLLGAGIGLDRRTRRARVTELLELVGLGAGQAERRPGALSGGQRQRVVIARALALEPRLIVCDEPVSALDVSIQSQILNLLIELQERLGLSYLFISHDLSVVRHIADRVAVMYFGKIVETGPVDRIFDAPMHPYTRALLAAVPRIDRGRGEGRVRSLVEGEQPDPLQPPAGCVFASRCPQVLPSCLEAQPALLPVAGQHLAACPVTLRDERT